MSAHVGTVVRWSDEGWGVVASDVTPGGCWVHFGAIGPMAPAVGTEVEFEFEEADQDGYRFRATRVREPGGSWPSTIIRPASAAYQSSLTVGGRPATDLLRRADAELERIVASLGVDDWGRPTPSEVSVRELVEHVVQGNLFAERLLEGVSASDALAGLDGDLLGTDTLASLRGSARRQLAAFAAADPDRALHHPSGDIDLATFLRFRAGDVLVHAWDIAHAAGLDEHLDPEAVMGLWTLVEPHLEEMRASGAYGEGASEQLPADVPLQTRLLDAFGRRA